MCVHQFKCLPVQFTEMVSTSSRPRPLGALAPPPRYFSPAPLNFSFLRAASENLTF